MTTEHAVARTGVSLNPSWGDDPLHPEHLERLRTSVVLQGVLVARSALHIGAPGGRDPMASSSHPIRRGPGGAPVVPGTALRGALRGSIEVLLLGMGLRSRVDACDPLESACLDGRKHGELARSHGDDQSALSREVLARSCATCHLFGSPWLRSRVRVSELELEGACQTEVRFCRPISRDRQLSGAAWSGDDFEVVAPGARFRFSLNLVNPRDWEIGLVMAALRQLDEGYVLLGGRTSQGLGRVGVSLEGVRIVTADDLLMNRPGRVVGVEWFREHHGVAVAEVEPLPADESVESVAEGTDGGEEDASSADEASPGESGELSPAYAALVEAVREAVKRVGPDQPNHSVIPQFMAAAGWPRDKLIEAGLLSKKRRDWKIFYRQALEAGVVWGDEVTLMTESPGGADKLVLADGSDAGSKPAEGGSLIQGRAEPVFGTTPADVRALLAEYQSALEEYLQARCSHLKSHGRRSDTSSRS